MKIIKEVRQVGTGNAIAQSNVTVQSWIELGLIATGVSDSNGLATITAQGSPGSVRVRAERGLSYDEYSENIQPTGQFDLDHLRTRLGAIVPDGIVGHYGSAFRATIGPGGIALAAGAVVLDGILAVFPSATVLTVSNGDRAAVAVLSSDAIYLADIDYAVLSSSVHVPIYRYTVASGNVVSSSLTPIHRLAGPRRGSRSIISISRLASGTTLNASGETSGLETSLDLESGVTYDIKATAKARGMGRDGAIAVEIDGNLSAYASLNGDVAGKLHNRHVRTGIAGGSTKLVRMYERRDTTLQSSVSEWELQATHGPTFNALALSNPGQVAVDSTGRILIADTGNNRLVILTSAGAYSTGVTGLTGITGVCVDSWDNIYVCMGTNGWGKYNSSLVVQHGNNTIPGRNRVHVATDGTHYFMTNAEENTITKVLCSTGGIVATYGSSGSNNGQFNTPYGICYQSFGGGYLYIVDSGNNRVQGITRDTGTYVSQWPISAGARGITAESSGELVVAEYQFGAFRRYSSVGVLLESIGQQTPSGIAWAPGDIYWISNGFAGTIAKWDEVTEVQDLPFEYEAALLTAIAVPRG